MRACLNGMREIARQSGSRDTTKLLRIAGLPAVSALFSVAPLRVERLFFVQRMQPYVGDFCAALARMRKSYRLVRTEELEHVAGTVLHGGIVALAPEGKGLRSLGAPSTPLAGR